MSNSACRITSYESTFYEQLEVYKSADEVV